MPKRKYHIRLSEEKRTYLTHITQNPASSSRAVYRARILLLSDESQRMPLTVQECAALLHTSATTVQRVRTHFISRGLEGTITRKQRDLPPRHPKITKGLQSRLIALCCSAPPKGCGRWTIQLLTQRCVELGYVDDISPMTICRALKQIHINLRH